MSARAGRGGVGVEEREMGAETTTARGIYICRERQRQRDALQHEPVAVQAVNSQGISSQLLIL